MSPYRRLDAIATMILIALGLSMAILLAPRLLALRAQPQPDTGVAPPTAVVVALPTYAAPLASADIPSAATAQPVKEATPLPVFAPPPVPLAAPPPILMYHYIRAVDAAADPLGYALSIAPELFEQQIALLAARGYNTVTMATLTRCLQGEPICPPQPVALTFDDGYTDAYSVALPILQRYGFSATFYIVSEFIGQPGYLTWEQVTALHAAGMEIGAHSLTHPDLTTLDPAEMARQVQQSKRDIEERLGVAVTSFCYPAGRYNAATIAEVRAAGYTNAVTTRWDSDYSDIVALPRGRVAGATTAEELLWIVGAQ